MKRCGIIFCIAALMSQLVSITAAETIANDMTDSGCLVSKSAALSSADCDYKSYVSGLPENKASSAVTIEAVLAQSTVNTVVKEDGLYWDAMAGEASWTISIPSAGWYAVTFSYAGCAGGGSNIELGLKLDGQYPFSEAKRFQLPRLWGNDGDVRRDTKGNEFAPEQQELYTAQRHPMRDMNGFVTQDMCLYLQEGTHVLTLQSYEEPFVLYSIGLEVPEAAVTQQEQLQAWRQAGITDYSGSEIPIEGESAQYKSSRSLIGLCDNSDPGVRPNDATVQKVNYIGGGNWSMPGDTIRWIVTVPEAGIYKLGIHFRQKYLINADSYRCLKINGEVQYEQLASIPFAYKNNWQFTDKLEDGSEILVFLKEGENELSMTVTLGAMGDYNAEMETLVLQLGDIYRDIVSVVGEKPDSKRDYDLFTRIPDLAERMTALRDKISQMIEEQRGKNRNIDDNSAMLKKMNIVLEKMLQRQYEAQKYKNNFYDCYSSLSARLQEMKNMALDIDALILTKPGTDCLRNTSGFGERMVFGIQRFIASFLLDYDQVGGTDGKENLTLWVNWSRDQTLVLNSLINSSFTPKAGISVTVRMTNASLLQGILSGNGPDCALSESRTTPVNLAMRGALVELSQFENFGEIEKRFVDHAVAPYEYNGGVFGLPSTQQFYMMFYRSDIFEQYGLTVPTTWEEFVNVAGILMLHNMQVGLPYVELKDIYQTDGGVASLNIFPTLLLQRGLSLYNSEQTMTTLTQAATIRVFEEWTDFYCKYNLPKEYSFFNRFRVGLMPLAVQSYTQYSVLSAAAPEIKGRWEMTEIPGFVQEDGTVNNTQAGFGTACVILKMSEHPEAAWELLQWWTSADTQYQYAMDIESILGIAGRYTSANVEATQKLDWGNNARKALLSQWHKVEEIAEVPGGYYVSRAIDQAFWNVLSQNANPKDMMKKWGEIADKEIETKITQYSGKGEQS